MIRVALIGSSEKAQHGLERIIRACSELSLAGQADSIYEARTMLLKNEPDVLIVDASLTDQHNKQLLQSVMAHASAPVVASTSNGEGCFRTDVHELDRLVQAVITRPDEQVQPGTGPARRIVRAIKKAHDSSIEKTAHPIDLSERSYDAILIGITTGGVKALMKTVSGVTSTPPPLLIVQHMPETFTDSFSQRLDKHSSLDIAEGADGERVRAGECRLAPGNQHMTLDGFLSTGVRIGLSDGGLVRHQRPSADVLFKTAARRMNGQSVLAFVMTGIGKDGRDGAEELSRNGADIVTQTKDSSVVYGMPGQVDRHVPTVDETDPVGVAQTINSVGT